eukprot:615221-Rhodomonas_salina.2
MGEQHYINSESVPRGQKTYVIAKIQGDAPGCAQTAQKEGLQLDTTSKDGGVCAVHVSAYVRTLHTLPPGAQLRLSVHSAMYWERGTG